VDTKEQKRRLKQLADAWTEVHAMPFTGVTDSIRRTLRLLELCPWLSGEQVTEQEPSPNGSPAASRKKMPKASTTEGTDAGGQ